MTAETEEETSQNGGILLTTPPVLATTPPVVATTPPVSQELRISATSPEETEDDTAPLLDDVQRKGRDGRFANRLRIVQRTFSRDATPDLDGMDKGYKQLENLWDRLSPYRHCTRSISAVLTGLTFIAIFILLEFRLVSCPPFTRVYAWITAGCGLFITFYTILTFIAAVIVCARAKVNNCILFIPTYSDSLIFGVIISAIGLTIITRGHLSGLHVSFALLGYMFIRSLLYNQSSGLGIVFACLATFLGAILMRLDLRDNSDLLSESWVYTNLPFLLAALCLVAYFAVELHQLVTSRSQPPYDSPLTFHSIKNEVDIVCDTVESKHSQKSLDTQSTRQKCMFGLLGNILCGSELYVLSYGLAGATCLCLAVLEYGLLMDIQYGQLRTSTSHGEMYFPNIHSMTPRAGSEMASFRWNSVLFIISATLAVLGLCFPVARFWSLKSELVTFGYLKLMNRSADNVIVQRPTYHLEGIPMTINPKLLRRLAYAESRPPTFKSKRSSNNPSKSPS